MPALRSPVSAVPSGVPDVCERLFLRLPEQRTGARQRQNHVERHRRHVGGNASDGCECNRRGQSEGETTVDGNLELQTERRPTG
jgi:hypothetical protein